MGSGPVVAWGGGGWGLIGRRCTQRAFRGDGNVLYLDLGGSGSLSKCTLRSACFPRCELRFIHVNKQMLLPSPGNSESAILGVEGAQGRLSFQQVPKTALTPSLAGTPKRLIMQVSSSRDS